MGTVSQWKLYESGMTIAGKRMRVYGKPGNFNQITNVTDGKSCDIPAGLVGRCDLVTASFVKITFRKIEGDNLRLWSLTTNLSIQNKEAGLLVGYLSPTRLRGMEVELF